MNPKTAQVLRDAVEYTRVAQPFIEKQAECERLAEHTVDQMILNGLLPFEKRAMTINELSDPAQAYVWLQKLASNIGPDSLGNISESPDYTLGSTADERLANWILS